VFGQRLDETVAYEQKFGPHLVPILVEKCAEFILEHGVSEEGIFRLPGQDNLVKQLRDAFDAGERPSFDRYAVLTGLVCLCPADWKESLVERGTFAGDSGEQGACPAGHSGSGGLSTVRRVCRWFM
jgi:hypothetical protein